MIYARVIKILHVYEIEKNFRISFACGSRNFLFSPWLCNCYYSPSLGLMFVGFHYIYIFGVMQCNLTHELQNENLLSIPLNIFGFSGFS